MHPLHSILGLLVNQFEDLFDSIAGESRRHTGFHDMVTDYVADFVVFGSAHPHRQPKVLPLQLPRISGRPGQ